MNLQEIRQQNKERLLEEKANLEKVVDKTTEQKEILDFIENELHEIFAREEEKYILNSYSIHYVNGIEVASKLAIAGMTTLEEIPF